MYVNRRDVTVIWLGAARGHAHHAAVTAGRLPDAGAPAGEHNGLAGCLVGNMASGAAPGALLYAGQRPEGGPQLRTAVSWMRSIDICSQSDSAVMFSQLAVFRPGTYQVTDYLLSWTYPDLSSLHDACPGPPLVSFVAVSGDVGGNLKLGECPSLTARCVPRAAPGEACCACFAIQSGGPGELHQRSGTDAPAPGLSACCSS